MNLLHSFLSQRDGDQKLKSQIKSSKFPHEQFYIKYISSPQEHKTFILFLDCLLLRNQNPEDLFILIKINYTQR